MRAYEKHQEANGYVQIMTNYRTTTWIASTDPSRFAPSVCRLTRSSPRSPLTALTRPRSQPQSFELAKELIAGFAGASVDRLV